MGEGRPGEPSLQPPRLLRAWRQALGCSGADLADRLAVSPEMVSQWERGRKPLGWIRLREVDAALSADGALIGTMKALLDRDSLPPRRTWDFNPPSQGGLIWAWITSPSSVAGRASLGPFSVLLPVARDTSLGLVVTVEAVDSNPPVRVVLDEPGWVAFGTGWLPPDLGLDVRDARQLDVEVGVTHSIRLAQRHLEGTRGLGWIGEVARALKQPIGRVEGIVRSMRPVELPPSAGGNEALLAEAGRRIGPNTARLVRESMGISRRELAELVSELTPSAHVTAASIVTMENGGYTRVEQLLPRVDRVLGLDGSLALEAVTVRQSQQNLFEVIFPDYWIGPVWVEFFPGRLRQKGDFDVRWSPWTKPVRARDGTIASMRRSSHGQLPLQVRTPPGGRINAGLGYHPRGVDINANWRVGEGRLGVESLAHYLRAIGLRPR